MPRPSVFVRHSPPMTTPRISPEVAAYLDALAPGPRALLERLRAAIHAVEPGMDEAIGYGIPVVRKEGRAVVGYAAFRAHCSLFPMGSAVLDAEVGEALAPWRAGKGTLRFTDDHPIPDALIARLVRERIAAEAARAAARPRRTRPRAADPAGGEA